MDRMDFVKGRVSEALRMAEKSLRKQQVLPYYWFKYQDHRDNFLSKVSSFDLLETPREHHTDSKNLFVQKDTENMVNTIASIGANGMIIWGSSEDVNTERKCKNLQQYVKSILGPALKRIKQQ